MLITLSSFSCSCLFILTYLSEFLCSSMIMPCHECFLSVVAQLRCRILRKMPQLSPITILIQGLWEHWCRWRQQPGRAASLFGDWVKASCCLEEKAGFNAFLDEVLSFIVPQLLPNWPLHSVEQVQDAANVRIHSHFGFDATVGAFSMPTRGPPSVVCELPAPPGALFVKA